jgi:DNA-binding SARP family transcriptional activator
MPTSSGAYARVLGPARLTIHGADAPPEILWRKHVALLVYLARSPRRARTREHLLGLLWSDRDERQARHSLSEALRVMRRTLGDEAVQADVDQIRLEPGAVAFDTDVFNERSEHGDWAGAAALVEGAFLEGLSIPDANEFESWLAAERAEWSARGVSAIVRHAEARLAAGDLVVAAGEARRALALDRAAEPAARAVMRALALMGDRAGALRVAEDLGRALGDELGAAPAPETTRLAERIREARVGRRVAAAVPAARARPPLVARAAELTALGAAWDRARAREGQVVLIEGEPGEGKSRLLDEFVARVRLEDATVAVARAVAADARVAWSALAGLLAGGLADAPGLAGTPPAALAALGTLDAGLSARAGGGAAGGIAIPAAVSAAVSAAAEERPLVLALDDAQWIDPQTLALLPGLARDTARRPVLLALGVARGSPDDSRFDELRGRLQRDLQGIVVRLGRLDEAALRSLIVWAVPQYRPEEVDRLLRRIERDTAGIPLLAVAMLEAVAQGFQIQPEAPAWPAAQRTLVDSLPNALPPAVVGTICLRFRNLPGVAQQVLGAAAALGERVEPVALAAATGLDAPAVAEALDLLEWERWVAVDGRGYALSAPIVRAVLLQEMVTPGQARRYRAAAPP